MGESSMREGDSLDMRLARIRDLINAPRKQHRLLRDTAKWSQLCSALDAIADAGWAISAHGNLRRSENIDSGFIYLAHYGLVQALYLQQNALGHLCEALGFSEVGRQSRDALRMVRGVRNDVAHLTDRGHGEDKDCLGIVRASMSVDCFEVYSFSLLGVSRRKVLCMELAETQHGVIVAVLDEIISALQEEVRLHRDKFKHVSLVGLLGGLDYHLSKVAVAISAMTRGEPWSGSEDVFALASLDAIERNVEALVESLRERGEYPGVYRHIDEAESLARRVIERLRKVLKDGASAVTDLIDAEGLVLLLGKQLVCVRDFAVDLDQSYSS
ncbi:hypothetical protein F0U60_20120 [Archangium minus]|uniref:PhoU domain-containing protein n=1 Tax=Archangium minus TaxID=83450 RepID=A0ABY9WQT2_9BACT|nr:hypothetical protein F0U60_20120 [Archangium minus]